MRSFSDWKQKPWIHEDLPIWKKCVKIPARFVMIILYLGLVIGGIYALYTLWDEINTPGYYYDFLGIYLPVSVMAIIALSILWSIGGYGTAVSIKLIVRYLQKEPFKLGRVPKVGVLVVIIMALFVGNYYYPQWPMEIGIAKPKFGPHIAIFNDTAMIVSWDTPDARVSKLYWGTEETKVNTEIIGTEHYWDTNTLATHHTALITGLIPGNKYYYTVPDMSSKVFGFKTPPLASSNENVTFTIVADTQGGLHGQRRNVELMLEKTENLAFTCIAGDLCNRVDSLSEWSMIFDSRSYGRIVSTIPFMNSPGNHETYCITAGCGIRSNFKQYFQYNYPGNRVQTEGMPDYGLYYSYNYSNVHMIALDHFDNATDYFSTAQLQWLEEDLTRASNANMWKFVYFHYPLYSLGDAGSNKDLERILQPIFEKYQVTGVFYGHDHHFEAFHVNATASWGGTYCFVVGGGGGGIDGMTNVDRYGSRVWPARSINWSESDGRFDGIYGHQYELYGELTQHFMKVDVQGNKVTFTAYRTQDGSKIVEYIVQR